MRLYDRDQLYGCPECKKSYRGNWVSRHLVEKHGYSWWDDERVVSPIEIELHPNDPKPYEPRGPYEAKQ